MDPSQIQESQLLQLHQLRELEEEIHVIVEPKAEDVVQAERVAQAEAAEHGQDGFGDDVLVLKVDRAEIETADFQTAKAQVPHVEVAHVEPLRAVHANA